MQPARRSGTRPRRRGPATLALLLGVLIAATALVGCGGGDDQVKSSSSEPTPSTTEASAPGTTAGGTPSGTVAPDAAGTTLDVTLVRGEKVGTAHRRVAPTTAVGRAAMEQLLAGPTPDEQAAGLSSAIPAGTRLLGLSIDGGTATVDLSNEFVSGGGSLSVRLRLAQVVYTLTQFGTVDDVAFRIDGKPTTVFTGDGVIIPSPAGRNEFRDVTPLVFLESVAPGDIVSSPVKVAGDANTFEGTVRIKLVGADGSVLADTFTTATSGSGTWGTFSKDVTFAKGTNTAGTVVVFWDSPKDGSPQDVTEVPVAFS